ncbi:DUF222 domain-containing protein [Modestobacter sp. I12A-02628]|uniref:DUF222 domain-containing protein n=2 Tax=Goekera deserti TaxID=2497753 RepID=A0A7K3WC93_9ACTN|nr:DUF222 domain-containing protein [Goekera deserti]NDI48342.1 DUF222 domain-containing protein [Goekera deserti]NEL54091.1 DUF222 domain-containing protein [Goekera deserti]
MAATAPPRTARRRVPVPPHVGPAVDAVPAARTGPPVGRSSGQLGDLQAAEWEIGRLTAARYRAAAAFARTRPACLDRPAGTLGAMSAATRAARPTALQDVSEWAPRELTIALSIGHAAAQRLLEHALLLVDRLPATLVALECGTVHAGHLRVFLEQVAPIDDAAVRSTVEADLIAWSAGQVTTPAQLADRAQRVVLRLDATAAARRLERAIRSRGVYLSADREAGMEQLTAVLTTPEARACWQVLGAYADLLPDDPDAASPRTRAQKMVDVLLDLVLRPGAVDLPPVQARLTVVATVETLAGGDAPGEVDGQVVPAEMVRHLARGLGLLPEPRPPAGVATPDQDAVGAPAGESADPRAGISGSPRRGASWPDEEVRTGDHSGHDLVGAQWGAAPSDEERRLLAAVQAEERKPVDQQRWPVREQLPPELADSDLPDVDDDAGWAALWQDWRAREIAAATSAWDAEPLPDPVPRRPRSPLAGPGDESTCPGRSAARSTAPACGTETDLPGWSAVDDVVQAASRLLEDSRRAIARARHDVATAEHRAAADERAHAGSPAGRLTDARTSVEALTLLSADQRATVGDLLLRTGGGGLVDRPRLAVVDALTGTLLALTDAPRLRRLAHCGRRACARRTRPCTHDLTDRPGLLPPPPTPGYRPGAELDRFVRARDRRCRFPGCRNRVPLGGELDHAVPYPDGPTSAANLGGYCTRDHRGKHQAPGWQHELHADGRLTVTTPTGLTTTTRPPGYVDAPPGPGTPPGAHTDTPPF